MIIYGKNPVFEALKCELVQQVYIRKGTALYDTTFQVPVNILGKAEFDSRFSREAQGIAADIDELQTVALNDAKGLDCAKGVLILDRIQDPHNYGAIIRSAHCFGIDHIVVPRYNQAPLTATVCKASAGAIFYSVIIEETNLVNVSLNLKGMGFTLVACDMDTAVDVKDVDKKGKLAVVLGSEGHGIRDGLRNVADVVVRIPMMGKIDSLNAAQSATVAMYELFSR